MSSRGPAGLRCMDERVSFAGRPAPRGCTVRVFVLPPGTTHPYEETLWRGALIVVERGAIELECVRGGRRRFAAGAVLWLAGVPLRAVHNTGPAAAVLSAVTRREPGAPGSPGRGRLGAGAG